MYEVDKSVAERLFKLFDEGKEPLDLANETWTNKSTIRRYYIRWKAKTGKDNSRLNVTYYKDENGYEFFSYKESWTRF